MIFLFPRWDMLIPWRSRFFFPMSRFLQVQLGLAEPDPPPAMPPSPPETVRVVVTPAPMPPETSGSVKDSLASTILEAHLFVVNHSLKHVNMRLSSMGQLPLKLAWNSQLTWHPSLSIIYAGVRSIAHFQDWAGRFFFPTRSLKNEERRFRNNGS